MENVIVIDSVNHNLAFKINYLQRIPICQENFKVGNMGYLFKFL